MVPSTKANSIRTMCMYPLITYQSFTDSIKLQPHILPRPDLTRLGVRYRRIPVLSIGKDIYLDTRLILRKLEELYPVSEAHRPLCASTEDQRAIECLLGNSFTSNRVFKLAVQLIPADLPHLKDPAFLMDRADLAGVLPGASLITAEEKAAARPQSLCEMREEVRLLETTLLADGRHWILNTEGPMLADIEALWLLYWLKVLPGALPPDLIGPKQFPKVFAHLERFEKKVTSVQELGQPGTVDGEEVVRMLSGSDFAEPEGDVDVTDPWVTFQNLREGDSVKVWPTDYGINHKDEGILFALDEKEIVIQVTGDAGDLRVHAPRCGFTVQRTE